MLSRRSQTNIDTVIPRLLAHFHTASNSELQPIDLTQAENHVLRDQVLEIIHTEFASNFLPQHLSYPTGIGGDTQARESLAEFLSSELAPLKSIEPSHLVLTSGASEAVSILAYHLCDAGEGVLLAAPYWSGLDLALETRSQARAVAVDIPLQDILTVESVRYYEEALAASEIPIRAILVTNPHNPLGRCYPKAVLQALLQFCARHGLHYISDEVYALCCFDRIGGGEPFTSITGLIELESPRSKIHAVYSLSKDFGCSGIRLGMILSQDNPDLRMGSALIAHASVSNLTTAVVPKLLKTWREERYADKSSRGLYNAYGRILGFLRSRNIDHVPVSAGLCVFARLGKRGTAEEETLLLQELARVNLKLVPGSLYHFSQRGWFRIIFSVPSAQMDEAMGRLSTVLDTVNASLGASEAAASATGK